jgi:hypothetical protein
MGWLRTGLAVAAGATVARAVAHRKQNQDDGPRWLSVTVNAQPGLVREDPRLREAFARLGPDVETRVVAAPGGKGTEIGALHRNAPAGAAVVARVTGTDPRQEVRTVLREVKSLIETGEVVRPDAPATGKPTPGGALVRLATRRAGGEGRL